MLLISNLEIDKIKLRVEHGDVSWYLARNTSVVDTIICLRFFG